MPNPVAYIELLSGEPVDRVQFLIEYGEKKARLELPVVITGREQVPGTIGYRKDLEEFLLALQSILHDPQGLQWPSHQ